jgi:hypothetical protein
VAQILGSANAPLNMENDTMLRANEYYGHIRVTRRWIIWQRAGSLVLPKKSSGSMY